MTHCNSHTINVVSSYPALCNCNLHSVHWFCSACEPYRTGFYECARKPGYTLTLLVGCFLIHDASFYILHTECRRYTVCECGQLKVVSVHHVWKRYTITTVVYCVMVHYMLWLTTLLLRIIIMLLSPVTILPIDNQQSNKYLSSKFYYTWQPTLTDVSAR